MSRHLFDPWPRARTVTMPNIGSFLGAMSGDKRPLASLFEKWPIPEPGHFPRASEDTPENRIDHALLGCFRHVVGGKVLGGLDYAREWIGFAYQIEPRAERFRFLEGVEVFRQIAKDRGDGADQQLAAGVLQQAQTMSFPLLQSGKGSHEERLRAWVNCAVGACFAMEEGEPANELICEIKINSELAVSWRDARIVYSVIEQFGHAAPVHPFNAYFYSDQPQWSWAGFMNTDAVWQEIAKPLRTIGFDVRSLWDPDFLSLVSAHRDGAARPYEAWCPLPSPDPTDELSRALSLLESNNCPAVAEALRGLKTAIGG